MSRAMVIGSELMRRPVAWYTWLSGWLLENLAPRSALSHVPVQQSAVIEVAIEHASSR
jgi:hypothetical protein